MKQKQIKLFAGIILAVMLGITGLFLPGSDPAPEQPAGQTEVTDPSEGGQQNRSGDPQGGSSGSATQAAIDENGSYTARDDVARYLMTYGRLPRNFITKKEATELGWESREGNLHDVAPGMSIGGDRFSNREGLLPKQSGRTYYECDIDYAGGFRGSKRIVYSNDGLIFYTEDHYKSFTEWEGV